MKNKNLSALQKQINAKTLTKFFLSNLGFKTDNNIK